MTEEQQPEPDAQARKVLNLDPRSLRGIAHPLRMRLLSSLRLDGPATASQLAQRLSESSGATSYHLRQLAEYGFVEDDPERGKGRERWWRAAYAGTYLDSELGRDADPAVRGAYSTYLHQHATNHAEEVSTWIATRHEWSQEWAESSDISDFTLRLTPDSAAELSARMHELIEEYRTLTPAEGAPDAAKVRLHTHLIPTRHTD
ncbi:ArsR/SmtB family transcription factor [Streptomyces flavofungini]|uniref:Helix-turn-helix transcriptional regulator n=1 Tax=Streptomyces flavofungini TaxID=68200 RepID=A0ABS0XFP6_9ACTN|nr:helix-turn-helix domain-containing protein [Streptomyces flavofungini]MBJ3812047.1 helix-turn-helix transcriptional regulator [Streptomyces flavofungini]